MSADCLAVPINTNFAKQEDQDKIREQLNKLEQDLIIHKHTLDLNLDMNNKRIDFADKRISDFGVLATMQGSHTSWAALAVTLIMALFGFLTYINVKQKAITEARKSAEEWFNENSLKLNDDISKLKSPLSPLRL